MSTPQTPAAALAVRAHSASLVSATLQGCVLACVSNILAQTLTHYRSPTSIPFAISPTPILHFLILTVLNTPPNFLWQEYLERSFPGYSVSPVVVGGGGGEKGGELLPRKKLDVTNTLIKFSLDQTLGALYNTVIFLAVMQALKGESAEAVWGVVRRVSSTLLVGRGALVFGNFGG